MNPVRNAGEFLRNRYEHDRVEAAVDIGFLCGGLLTNPVTFRLGLYTLGGTGVLVAGKYIIQRIRGR